MESRRASPEQRRERAALDARSASTAEQFGKIGISAVAAALRYQGEAKNPAYAPAGESAASQFEEAAA